MTLAPQLASTIHDQNNIMSGFEGYAQNSTVITTGSTSNSALTTATSETALKDGDVDASHGGGQLRQVRPLVVTDGETLLDLTGWTGSLRYMAPEVALSKPVSPTKGDLVGLVPLRNFYCIFKNSVSLTAPTQSTDSV